MFDFLRRKRRPAISGLDDKILEDDICRMFLDRLLEQLARRESRSKLAIEREILTEGIIRRINSNTKEDMKNLRRSGHNC